jgi:hypothetical protein
MKRWKLFAALVVPLYVGVVVMAFIITASFSASTALAQKISTVQPPDSAPSPENPYNVNCGNKPPYKSQSARSRVLLSPDGNREAYAEAKSQWVGSCVNTSAVFVRAKSSAYELVFLQEPTEEMVGNGVRLIDWSKDGTKLLFEVIRWQDGSDAGPSNEIWIYDAVTGVFTAVPTQHVLRSFGGGCFTIAEPLGFSATGTVAVQFLTKQNVDEEGTMVLPKCNKTLSTWLFDPRSNLLTQARGDQAIPKWGKIR